MASYIQCTKHCQIKVNFENRIYSPKATEYSIARRGIAKGRTRGGGSLRNQKHAQVKK